MLHPRSFLPFLFLALLFQIALVKAEQRPDIQIEITRGNDTPVRVAVVPFEWRERKALAEDPASIVVNDLKFSGRIETLPAAQMLSLPHNREQVFYRDWKLVKADFLVIGRLYIHQAQEGKRNLRLRYEMFNIPEEKLIFSHEIEGEEVDLRDMAHHVSDQIFYAITRIPGVFSTQIMYITAVGPFQNKRYSLTIADADGHRPSTLFSSYEPIMSPAWAPDGKKVAYVSYERNSKPAIYLHHLDTGRKEQLTNYPGLNGAPSFSPDGRYLAFVLSKGGNPDIYTLELETRVLRRITRNREIDTEPDWTSDGKSLIFTSNRGAQPQIYMIELESLSVERLTYEGDYNARGRMLPDGSGLIMVHRKNGIFHISLLDLERRRLRDLTETSLDESPSIAPNGNMLIYATKEGDREILAAVDVDARVRFNLPSVSGDIREPAWSRHKRREFSLISEELSSDPFVRQ